MDISWRLILVILKQEFLLKSLILVIGKTYNGLYKLIINSLPVWAGYAVKPIYQPFMMKIKFIIVGAAYRGVNGF